MTQSRSRIRISKLMNELARFGLSATDWRLETWEDRGDSIKLRHRDDPDFKLKGDLIPDANGSWRLGTLRLVSL